MGEAQDTFQYALSSNAAWAGYKSHQNPSFFTRLAGGQKPEILWLGCSDSRCPETTILGLQPGDVFVHRNIANIISPTDINTWSVIEFAVVHLQVKHVVLCGHSSCGGAHGALSDDSLGGLLDIWLTPLRMLRQAHADELSGLGDIKQLAIRLAELNVDTGVRTIMANAVVMKAIRERGLQVHGVFFDIASGRLRNLHVGTSSPDGGDPGDGVVRGNHGTLVFRGGNASMTIR